MTKANVADYGLRVSRFWFVPYVFGLLAACFDSAELVAGWQYVGNHWPEASDQLPAARDQQPDRN